MKTLINFLKKWNELISIPLAMLIFFISPYLLRSIDPTAGAYDAGIFQILLFAIISFLVCQAMIWIILGMIWPKIREHFETGFNSDFLELTPWQRTKTSLLIYFALFFLLVFCTRIL